MRRKVLITGVSSGIGAAIRDKLLKEGEEVFGISRQIPKRSHPHFYPYAIDLADLKTLPLKLSLFENVDALICNVGRGHFGSLEELSLKQIHALMDLNFFSHIYLIKTLLISLKKKKRSDIIFIGSEASLVGKQKGSIYSASKFALRGFAQSLRAECARTTIQVSMIQPGMVRTPFYDNLNFEPGQEEAHAILPKDIADIVALILKMRQGTICDEIILSPQKKVIRKKLVKPLINP